MTERRALNSKSLQLLLADDDRDDCLFFEEALGEIPLPTHLVTSYDGEQLLKYLRTTTALPDVLFLDLNLPRKNGFECLSEIKLDLKLAQVFVIIFTTSSEQHIVNLAYQNGAHYFIRKPSEFSKLTKVIQLALNLILETVPVTQHGTSLQPARENFVISE